MSLRRVLLSSLLVVAVLAPATSVTAQEGPSITSQVVASFDGTPIETTLFLPPGASDDAPVPLILRTHGWGGTGETEVGGGTLARLLDEGYAVLTWDQRGFGCSGGIVQINDPDTEGRDVSALIDWAVDHAPIATDASGDPVVGMTGGSYAGGIQMATAAVDARLDALAPEIAWSDLRYSLFSGEVPNQGWVLLLYGAGKATAELLGMSPECASGPHPGAGLDPAIDRGFTEFVTSGTVRQHTVDFFARSSLLHYGVERPTTLPTLVMQGSVDTLFDLTDGYRIHEHVRDQGVDSRFVVFCGGHVACPPSYADAGDRAHLDDAIVAWFARHLKGEDVDTGPTVEYRTNEGVWRGAESFPPAGFGRSEVTGAAEGLVALPVVDFPDPEPLLEQFQEGFDGIPGLPTTIAAPSQDGDPRATTFPVLAAEGGDVEVVGIPEVTLTVRGTHVPLETALAPLSDGLSPLSDGFEQVGELLVGSLDPVAGIVQGVGGIAALAGLAEPAAHVHVKLVDREAGEVLNLQEGSVRIDLTEDEVTVDVPMAGLAYTLPEGHHLDLQVATNSLMHASGRVPALLDIEVAAAIPTSGAVAPAATPDDGAATDDTDDADGDGTAGGDGGAVPAEGAPLPVTGGGAAAGLALSALAGAAVLRQRRALT